MLFRSNTGWGYFSVFALALVPPIWHWYMRKRLATWDEKFATAEERGISKRINKKLVMKEQVLKEMNCHSLLKTN